MKNALSILLAIAMLFSSSLIAFAVNEPTTEAMEKIIKLVKPKLDIPEEATEFTWNYAAGNVYSDASWRLIWQDKEHKMRYSVRCDESGRILDYSMYDNASAQNESILPSGTREEFADKAVEYIEKLLPEAAKSLELTNSYSNGIYSKTYTYDFTRYENGYPLFDNTVSLTLNYITGTLKSLRSDYNYNVAFTAPGALIGDDKAKELLSTKQEMNLTYISKSETVNEKTVVKAVLVYAPQKGYAAVDAVTGEIYDTKSDWMVKNSAGGSSATAAFDTVESNDAEMKTEGYKLSDEENAQLSVLEKLITKEAAVKAVTENKYLFMPAELTAVEGYLNKNRQTENSYYQDDKGSYTWRLSFSNPVLNDGTGFRRYSFADATVNADTGVLVSYSTNLATYWDYTEAKENVPEVKYSEDEAREIAEVFLKEFCKDKFEDSQLSDSYSTNIIAYKNTELMTDPVYGAYCFRYNRVNEGVPYIQNYIYIGVDGVTGKIYEYNYRWNTNIEFQSPNGAISPEKALEYYINLGINTVYEISTTYIYTPANDKSKSEIMKAFILSLAATVEQNGDLDAIIKKYASGIDKEKLMALIEEGDEKALWDFVGTYYGINVDEKLLEEYEASYSDLSDFYSREEKTRLVYTLVFDGIRYIDPFDGKGLNYSGEVPEAEESGYSYTDIDGHWAEKTIKLLGEIGIGFKGGKFEPDKKITGREFCELSSKLGFNVWNETKDAYKLINSEAEASRIDAVKYVLTSIDYDKVAVLKNIFRTEFADNADIKEEDIGFVAIANALGIVHGDGELMRTYDALTRAEAVTLLLNTAASVK